ncbi:WD40-repeat-containing domain protein [Auriculariales sp. MPI-PUGE-AT-0066]|nr:WD40-repeat-containing domain protein [Auriculariales sp. MPI-PUGE-AT-0066]
MADRQPHVNGATIRCVACAADLVAFGDDQSLVVLHVANGVEQCVATFFIGTPVLTLAFSPRTISPSADTLSWSIQLAIACGDGHIRLCTYTVNAPEPIIQIVSTAATTHSNDITGLAFSGSSSGRYLASSSLDRTCIVWDLEVLQHELQQSELLDASGDFKLPSAGAYGDSTRFANPLLSVAAHPQRAEFLISDNTGSVLLFDWADSCRAVVELVDPRTLADARTGVKGIGLGGAAWKAQDADFVGGAFGTRWVVWNLSHGGTGGGKPVLSGNSGLVSCNRFRWSPTDPTIFAVSSNSPAQGAVVNVFSTQYPQAQPTSVSLASRPNKIQDFDFLSGVGLVVAVGRRLYFVSLSNETQPVAISSGLSYLQPSF